MYVNASVADGVFDGRDLVEAVPFELEPRHQHGIGHDHDGQASEERNHSPSC
jgi:hypothetical protein